ncbi:MAG: hypothetical protein WC546_03900 [Candidatus Omnitrophota bacterium]
MKKIFLVLTSVSLLVISGCGEENFSRYPSVTIPEFSNKDYYAQLSDKNPQVVYNAVVNLGGRAVEFGKMLSDDKADKKLPQYIGAEKTYRKITELLNSSDVDITAASLRFLQLFSTDYAAKAEMLNPILKIKSDNRQVAYEQIVTLERISNKDTRIADSVLRKFLDNPSWIVSRSSYLLIDKLENENLRQELIARYRTIANEEEKLLILTAFKTHSGDSDADFFFNEIQSAKSDKIRYAIYDALGNCKNQEKVLAWIAENYGKITNNDKEYLFRRYAGIMDEDFSSRLLAIFLKNGFSADKDFLVLLNKGIESYTYSEDAAAKDTGEKLDNLKMIEEALFAGKVMVSDWQAILKKREAFNANINAMQTECNALTKKFSASINTIFKKYGVSEEKRKLYLENTAISRETLETLFEPDKESKNQK